MQFIETLGQRRSTDRLFRPAFRVFLATCLACFFTSSCAIESGDKALTQRTYIELVDWHISGFWVINCPVAWVRVANYNNVPIKDIEFEYDTYDAEGNHLDHGTYPIEGTVPPGGVRNFIELYLGLVNLHSEKLSIKLLSVTGA